jgi:hypothetical protein
LTEAREAAVRKSKELNQLQKEKQQLIEKIKECKREKEVNQKFELIQNQKPEHEIEEKRFELEILMELLLKRKIFYEKFLYSIQK